MLQELACSLVLAPAWSVDLCRPYADSVGASDAAQDFGFGVSVCSSTPEPARSLISLSEWREDYVRLSRGLDDEAERPRLGAPHKLDLKKSEFKDVISARTQRRDHPRVMELGALIMLLQWALRKRSR